MSPAPKIHQAAAGLRPSRLLGTCTTMRTGILFAVMLLTSCRSLNRPSRVPAHFVRVGASPPHQVLKFSVALPQRGLKDIEQELLEVADPSHPRYGQWRSLRDIAAQTAAVPSSRARVRAWLENANVTCGDTPGSLSCTGMTGSIEFLLNTRLSCYRDSLTGRRMHRVDPSETFAFPPHLVNDVHFLTHVYDFPTARRLGSRVLGGANFATAIETIQRLYSFSGVVGSAASSVGPVQFYNSPAVLRCDLTS